MKQLLTAGVILASVVPVMCAAQDSKTAKESYVNFDPPGVVTSMPAGAYVAGTTVMDMNDRGDIIGHYTSSSSISTRGFLRDRRGKITLLDDPRAGTPVEGGVATVAGTYPEAINQNGTVVGFSLDANSVNEGFIYSSDSNFNDFSVTGVAGNVVSTQALSINAGGQIAGRYSTYPGPMEAAYIRDAKGNYTDFQAPDANLSGIFSGTVDVSINDKGATTGYYYDSNAIAHSFVRSADGVITEFEVPGTGTNSYQGAWPMRIYDSGVILGFYYGNNWAEHSYIRLPDGTILPVEVPQGSSWTGVYLSDIGPEGEVAGTFLDANNVGHAFLRTRDGRLFQFTDPGAGSGAYQGTYAVRVNGKEEVAGNYIDANGLYHGFVWTPLAAR